MFYLILAILSSSCVSIVMRLSVNKTENSISMLSAGYFSCMVLSFIYGTSGISDFSSGPVIPTIILGIIGGALLLAGFIALQVNVKENGIVLSGIFSKLGIVVPVLLSVIFFRERPEITQIAGFILAIVSILLINSEKEMGKVSSMAALILLLLSNGLADSMAKFFDQFGNHNIEEFYFIFTFVVAFLLSLILAFVNKQSVTKSDIIYGLLLGIPNYYSIRFLTNAVMKIPSVICYPTYSVATIVLLTITGIICFKERPGKKQKAGILVILLALILLNM